MTDPARIEAIINAALALVSDSERTAFLEGACLGDTHLLHRVQEQLAERIAPRSHAADALAAATVNVAPSERVGTRIGPYRLLQELGEGGMGRVFLAEQHEPVQRRVALKVIKAGMDSRQVIARFEAEKQALALMDHPHIAKVFDAGTTQDGRPFFVMELVKGIPITQYCDQEHLAPRERLQLFIPVCQAVQHAHQKGIIHRDLKPSNVIVALYDGTPVPKVIDFGVAKATGPKLTERTMFTEVGQMIGTLEYMAPEQAELNNLDIDTRADIYSLGVLLYELLTGSPPFSGKELRSAAFDEMLRIIREVEPPKPSTKLSRSDELPVIAAKRKLEPQRLTRLISGELDWVVMKCLEKERARRYQTATGLAADIEHYLRDEPVMAGRPSRAYRVRKLVRRNKTAIATATLVALSLLTGLIGTSWQAIRATQAERLALVRQEEAEAAAEKERLARESEAHQRRQAEQTADDLRQTQYARSISAAFAAWNDVNPERARELMEKWRPTGAQHDLRGFEWYFLENCLREDYDNSTGKTLVSSRGRPPVAYSPDGRSLAVAVEHEGVVLWDVTTQQEQWLFRNASDDQPATRYLSVAFAPSSPILAVGMSTAGDDPVRQLCMMDVSGGSQNLPKTTRRFGPLPVAPSQIGFSPDGAHLAFCYREEVPNVVGIWSVSTERVLWTQADQVDGGYTFSPDNRFLVTCGAERGHVSVWDRETGALVTKLDHKPWAANVAYSPDGQVLMAVGTRGLRQWDANTFRSLSLISSDQRMTHLEILSRGPGLMATASQGCAVDVQDWSTAAVIRRVLHERDVWSTTLDPSGKQLATVAAGGKVQVWDLASARADMCECAGYWFTALAISSQRDIAAIAAGPHSVKLWNMETGETREASEGHSDVVLATAFAPGGHLLASSGLDGTVALWESQTLALKHQLRGHTAGVWAVAFSPDGTTFVSAGAKGEVILWDTQSLQEKARISCPPQSTIRSVAFSRDGDWLALGAQIPSAGATILLDAGTCERIHEYRHQGRVDCVAFSSDGRWLAASDRIGDVTVWDTRDRHEAFHRRVQGIFVASIAFSPDSTRLACSTAAGDIVIYRLPDGEEVGRWRTRDTVRRIVFTSDGKSIVSASLNGLVRIWRTQPRRR